MGRGGIFPGAILFRRVQYPPSCLKLFDPLEQTVKKIMIKPIDNEIKKQVMNRIVLASEKSVV